MVIYPVLDQVYVMLQLTNIDDERNIKIIDSVTELSS